MLSTPQVGFLSMSLQFDTTCSAIAAKGRWLGILLASQGRALQESRTSKDFVMVLRVIAYLLGALLWARTAEGIWRRKSIADTFLLPCILHHR